MKTVNKGMSPAALAVLAAVMAALALTTSPWFWAGVLLVAFSVLAFRLSRGRWHWQSRPAIVLKGLSFELASGGPADFLDAAADGARAALKAPFRAFAELIERSSWEKDEEVRARLASILHRTRLQCADCGCPISSRYQDELWLERAPGALVMGTMSPPDGGRVPTADGLCPECGGRTGLFFFLEDAAAAVPARGKAA